MNEISAVKLRIKSELVPVAINAGDALREAFWNYSDIVGFPVAANFVLDLILDLRKDFIDEDSKN